MNILKRELISHLKAFLFWCLGLLILMYAGMGKFEGLKHASSKDLNALFDQFPRVIKAVFGMVDVDPTSLWGYFSMMTFYIVICGAIYGIHLGSSAVSRESIDKTYEFLFTKPRTRTTILNAKLMAGFIYLTGFSIMNYLFCLMSFAGTNITDYNGTTLFLFCLEVYVVSLLFFCIAAAISALVQAPERGSLAGNLIFLFAFLMGILCDMMEHPGAVKILSPLKYFSPKDIIAGNFSVVFTLFSLVLCILLLGYTYIRFQRKDLNAV